nr:xylulose kinase-1 [Tanacetum cinerariifolium]
ETVHKERRERMERGANTASSLEAELDSEKPTESAGFEQIIYFLNAKPIKYALTVNPTVYTSCVKKFWTTAKVKKVNGQEQIQALVDKQKVIITEESIRCDLQFDDAEGAACLPNDTIFEELARMGAKITAWNEFSSTMAYAIICLANNQKFNFFKQGQGFSRNVTPLFETIMVHAQEEVGEGSGLHIDSHYTPTDTQSSLSKPQKKQKSKRKQRKTTEVHLPSSEILVEESVTTPSNDPLPSEKSQEAKKKERKSRPIGLRRLKKVSLSSRVESSEEKDSLGAQEDASKQKRSIEDIDKDVEVTLVDETQDRYGDDLMFDTGDLTGKEVFAEKNMAEKEHIEVEKVVSTTEIATTTVVKLSVAPTFDSAALIVDSVAPTTGVTEVEITLAQALVGSKSAKPKVVIQDPEKSTTIPTVSTTVTTVITTPRAK